MAGQWIREVDRDVSVLGKRRTPPLWPLAPGFGEEATRGAAPWDEEAARVNNK
jgi:hypothetical protein